MYGESRGETHASSVSQYRRYPFQSARSLLLETVTPHTGAGSTDDLPPVAAGFNARPLKIQYLSTSCRASSRPTQFLVVNLPPLIDCRLSAGQHFPLVSRHAPFCMRPRSWTNVRQESSIYVYYSREHIVLYCWFVNAGEITQTLFPRISRVEKTRRRGREFRSKIKNIAVQY